jgi:hypothetical protein
MRASIHLIDCLADEQLGATSSSWHHGIADSRFPRKTDSRPLPDPTTQRQTAAMSGGGGGSSSGGSGGGLAVMLQRLRAAVPLGGWSSYHRPTAPDTPENDDGGGSGGGGDVEGLLAGSNGSSGGSSSAGGGGGGRIGRLVGGRPMLRLLEAYGDRRRRVLGRFKFMEPVVANSDMPVHLLALSLTLWVWGISLARAHTFTLFSFHPVFMSLACVLFMTEGVLVYRNLACFNFLSPIMKNSARVKLQNIHRAFHVLAAAFIGMGMAFIFSNKVKKHRTLLPTSIHAALGFLVCIGIVVQVMAGIEKLDAQRSGVERGGGSAGLYR